MQSILIKIPVCIFWKLKRELQLQLYLKNDCQFNTIRTGPQIAFANMGGTVTLKDYSKSYK